MMRHRLLFALACLPLAALGGCHSEGGFGYSADQFTYVSTEWRPYTVSLIDSRTGESVWSVDVPVGQQLVVGFREGSGPNQFKPDMMDWGLMPAGRLYGVRNNQLPVPPASSRRLETALRPTPELPGAELPGSPYAPVPDGSKADAADIGKIKRGAADPNAPARVRALPPEKAPEPMAEPMPEAVPPSQTEPSAPAPVPVPEPMPTPAEDPPVDLPQGTRGPR